MVGFIRLSRFCAEVEARVPGISPFVILSRAERSEESRRSPVIAVHRRGKLISLLPQAEQAGLAVGMRLREAQVIYPEAEFIPFVEDHYHEHWHEALDVCATYVSAVEPFCLGEVFLDLAGPVEPSQALAEIQQAVYRQTRFTCLAGAGPSKLVAKIAAQVEPGRTIAPEEMAEFLAPLAISHLWVLDKATTAGLITLGITTIGLLQQVPLTRLQRHFGRDARRLSELARGADNSPVAPLYPIRTIEARLSVTDAIDDSERLRTCLRKLSAEIAEQLHARRETCGRIAMQVETDGPTPNSLPFDFAQGKPTREGTKGVGHGTIWSCRGDRQVAHSCHSERSEESRRCHAGQPHRAAPTLRLRTPAFTEEDVLLACRLLLGRMDIAAAVTAITIQASDFHPCDSVQLGLFATADSRSRVRKRTLEALASAQEHFGSRAVMLGTDIEVPRRERLLALLTGGA